MKLITGVVLTLVAHVGFAEMTNPSILNVQRTMKKISESTVEKPSQVRVLFYGQSIVAQGWSKIAMANLSKRYPSVNFVYENRAIGGYTSEALIRTADSDLYPYYPDILFFHVYGSLDKYDEIIRRVREKTTAEIVLWSSHLMKKEDPYKMLLERDERTLRIREIAEKYGCMFVDLNRKWSEMIIGRGYAMEDLLADDIHMKTGENDPALPAYAEFIISELIRVPNTDENGKSGSIRTVKFDDESVIKNEDGSIKLKFKGNRVVAVSDGSGDSSGKAKVLLDGKPVSDHSEMYIHTRPSAIVNWMPMIRKVSRKEGVMPTEEKWTLTYLEGTERDGSVIHYRVDGSVTGFDGEGWSNKDFVSNSGKVIIESQDYHVWQYKYVSNKPEYGDKRFAKVGDKVEWETKKLFVDDYIPQEKLTHTVLIQNCSNEEHELTLLSDGKELGIDEFIIYEPSKEFSK